MIRTKAKNWLLSIALVMACFCFFACKDTKVKVESISFTEQSISMLVGEEYSPQIKILPSYANDRSYTLISGDVTALSVEGGTITALKPALQGVKLKVVSNENENVNDVITVTIYAEASGLSVPTNLAFDGNTIGFVGESDTNTSAYMLKINGQEINIGNNTEYSFDNIVTRLGDVYNKPISCSVKAVGDGKIFKDSAYSEEITFVKLSSVGNAYIENEVLYFDSIENVASYNVEVFANGSVIKTFVVQNTTFETKQLSVDIKELTDSVSGAEYVLKITPSIENYNAGSTVSVFAGMATELNYVVIGSVANVVINSKVISWNFVKNAQTYTVELYKNNALLQKYENVATNYMNIEYEDAGEYYCVVLANSSNANTTTGKVYSSKLNFTILPAPDVKAESNSVTWNNVTSAEGYLVTIKNDKGATLVNKKFVLDTSYDVRAFVAGTYNIEVVACGNGQELLSSKSSTIINWTVLSNLQVRLDREKLYWVDSDLSSLNKYHLKFNVSSAEQVDIVLSNDKLGSQYNYNETTNTYSYDLSAYDFVPEFYMITLQNVGEGNVFDAEVNMLSITKLADTTITGLNNKQFTINIIENAIAYKIGIYSASDTNFETPIITLENMTGGNKFDLDDSTLEAGNYVAKVFVYGNNLNIFDADNGNIGTTFAFEKLATPRLTMNGIDLKLMIEDVADEYVLFENLTAKNIISKEYDLSNLVAGDYTYTIQAKGNNANILDSNITNLDDAIKVKKLATPTIIFDKNTLIYTMSCIDEDYVEGYTFTLNNQSVEVINGKADCSTLMLDANTYIAKACAQPSDSTDYDLIIKSAEAEHSSSKLEGVCSFEIYDGKLVVIPTDALDGAGYSLQLRIENGDNDIILTDFIYTNSKFEMDLYDNKYNLADSNLLTLLQNPNQYTLYTTISQNQDIVVNSNEVEITEKLTVLSRVENISRRSQTIEFDIVANATNYIAVIAINGAEHYINIAGKYSTGSSVNVLNMADLKQLMGQEGVEYLTQTVYTISFVAVSQDVYTLANKAVNSYAFEFLQAPTISIIEQAGDNAKYIAIANTDEKSNTYNVVVTQGDTTYNATWTKSAEENTLVLLDNMTRFVAGDITIEVKSNASTGNYFESKYSMVTATKLNSSAISIANGVLVWDVIANAKQYNLVYTVGENTETIALYEGVDNFEIQDNKCVYNFDGLESGLTDIYVQVDSVLYVDGKYYLNSNNGPVFGDMYKLPTLEISIKGGEIYTEIRNSDLALVDKIEVLVDNQPIDIDITTEQDNIKLELTTDKLGITISPVILLKYGVNELLAENIGLKLYSNNATTLNSSTASKDVYGLLSPSGLNITTDTTVENDVINEVMEKITWKNPSANGNYVSKYEIVINYNEQDYIFNSAETVLMMPTYYDENANGELDEDEVEFGTGVYTIKVRALTDNTTNIVNSKYCDEITVTVLETPTELSTKDGNVIWSSDINVEYYLIKVYLLNNNEQTLMISSETKVSEFDLCNLKSFDTGVYGVTVQAMHNNARILASGESEMLQVIRLPQVTSYFVQNGELYINAHAFYTRAEIYLTNSQTYTFEIKNSDLSKYTTFVEGMEDWASSTILDTYKDEAYFVKAKYVGEDGDSTLRTALAENYIVTVKLFGNTAVDGAIISGHTSDAINLYWENDDTVTNKNSVEKLVTPTVEVSETERGKLLLSTPNGLSYNLRYYQDTNGNALQGVHLYQVNVLTDEPHTVYVASIVDETLFANSLTAVGSELVQDDEDKNLLKHFEYNGYTFNVIDCNADGNIEFDFNVEYYHYYSATGVYTSISLGKGGKFVASARFMGDDSQFVQSNISPTAEIKRYSVLNLTVNNGALSWNNQATDNDHPIYLITLTNEAETYNLVLYNPSIHNKDNITSCLEQGKTYIFDEITYQTGVDQYITYTGLADVIYKSRQEASSSSAEVGGVFLASIRAHYTDTSATDIILSQGVTSKTIDVLPQTQLNVTNGTLTWNIVHVSNTGGGEDITNYLLQVFDQNGNVQYAITLKQGDYSVANGVATYEIGQQINNGEDDGFSFSVGTNYVFKLTALAGDSTIYINSIESATNAISILPNLQDVRMENGVLVWTNSTTNSVEVYVTYTSGDGTITYITTTTDSKFTLPESFVDTSGTSRKFVTGYDYHIKVRLRGTNNSLNGFFSNEVVTQRLATINVNDIVSNNGVLTWTANANEGVTYTVRYTLADNTTEETEMLDTNQYDFTGLLKGVITAQVVVHHNDCFSAFVSENVSLFKLAQPTNIVFNEGTTTISWDKVIDNEGNEVDNYKVSIMQEGLEPIEYTCDTNAWIITGVSSNAFSIAVKAISVQEKGMLINSDYTSYQSMEQPNQVDVETFVFDESLQAFIWKPIDGEHEGDKYYISYNYFAPNSETPVVDEPIQVTDIVVIDDEQYYVYYPSVIGRYSLIYVQIVRAESLSSQPTYCMKDTEPYVLEFNLFTSGDGVDNPYIISNETHLRNIKYFPSANYELDANITLTSNEPITDSTQVFTGNINGNSKYIYGATTSVEVTFSNSGYVGLFNKVAGATFTNIQLSGFTLKGYLGSASLHMGILVGHAEGLVIDNETRQTVFSNIVVTSSNISLTKNNQSGYVSDNVQVYIGAVAGYAQNAQFTNCTINLGTSSNIYLWIKGDASTKISVGSVAGYASDCKITGTNANSGNSNTFIIEYTLTAVESNIPTLNLGAVVGATSGENVILSGNSCEYTVYTSQGSTTNFNEVGKKN